jgi:predicted alpha/beta superfamily hydrolase
MKQLNRRTLLSALSAFCLAPPAFGQERGSKVPDYRIFDAPPATHVLSRHDITVEGQGYRLFLAVPVADPPAGGWPSLWMLDGNAVFDRIAAEDLEGHAGLVIVGIGYPVERIFDTTARALDYTPASLIPDPEGGRGRKTGGADAFRARLTGPLRVSVEERVRLDPARRVLWGHSYGGLFTLHCLLSEPEVFAGWAPTSPSSGFGGGVLRDMLARAPHLPPGRIAPLRIMMGDSEHRRGTEPPAQPRPSPETIALAELLDLREDLDVEVTVLEGLGHGQTFTASFARAMELASGI